MDPSRVATLAGSLLLATGLSAAAADVPGRPAGPVFPSAVDAIGLSVTVTDAGGRFVPGLAASDFKVYEDGVRQDVAVFTRGHVPLRLALLVDGSTSMDRSLPEVRKAARRLLQVLEEGDSAEVLQFNERVSVLQDFASDRQQLEAAVEGLSARGATGLYTALYVALKDPRFRREGPEIARRAIVLLTDGEDTASLLSDDDVLDLARRADVAVFTISFQAAAPASGFARRFFEADTSLRAKYFLATLARETGGASYFPRSVAEVDGIFARIGDELRAQYGLGYVSKNPARDGKWRRLMILSANADMRLQHRAGYYAPKAGPR